MLILCKCVLWIYNSLSLFSLRYPIRGAEGRLRCQGQCFEPFSPLFPQKSCGPLSPGNKSTRIPQEELEEVEGSFQRKSEKSPLSAAVDKYQKRWMGKLFHTTRFSSGESDFFLQYPLHTQGCLKPNYIENKEV